MIHNLLDNANKYSPESPSITVRTRNAAQGLLIEVEDNGVGLREEDQKRVFEKYFRVPSGDRHDVKGFGLGLSYVDLMMKAHGGRVILDSQFGRGTLVKLVFPVGPMDRVERQS
jgi:two-component system phosphate regulon sensor histidine kinase PhoR